MIVLSHIYFCNKNPAESLFLNVESAMMIYDLVTSGLLSAILISS